MGYKVSEATKEKIRLSREVNRERRAGQHEEQPPSSSVTEEELEAYHKGSKNKTYRPNGTEIQPKQAVEPRPEGVIGDIDNVKQYCYEIIQQTRASGRRTEIALVGLLHWFKVNYL